MLDLSAQTFLCTRRLASVRLPLLRDRRGEARWNENGAAHEGFLFFPPASPRLHRHNAAPGPPAYKPGSFGPDASLAGPLRHLLSYAARHKAEPHDRRSG